MQRVGRRHDGITRLDVVILAVVGVGLVALLLHSLPTPSGATHAAGSARCRSRMRQVFHGTRMYLNDFDEFFPLAWHEGSGSTVDTVTYNRFLIQVACDTNFASIEAEDDARKVEMLEQNVRFWSDPVEGLTDDYFSPPAIFRLPAPEERDKPYSKHTLYRAVTSRVVPVSMPFLADAAASTPRPDAEDAPPETRSGLAGAFKPAAFTFGDESYHAFYGVAKSWSRWDPDADLSEWNGTQNWGSGEERFDFRHNGAINVLFLDGHVDTIKKTHGDRLTKLHDNWNIDSEGAP